MSPLLEILFLFWFSKKRAGLASEKGRSKGWAALGVVLWILGELFGFIEGAALRLGLGAYLLALVAAAAGVGIADVIDHGLASEAPQTSAA